MLLLNVLISNWNEIYCEKS